jgi:hypothetical protein
MGVKWKVASRGAGSTEGQSNSLAECVQTASCEVVCIADGVRWWQQQCVNKKTQFLGYNVQWDLN